MKKKNTAGRRKEILDDNGNVRKGCKIVKKGEVYEKTPFTKKNPLFKQENFVDEVKHFYTDLINTLVKDDKEKLHIFEKNGPYLATKKIGKNNPKAEQIQTDNEYRMRWNCEVDRAIISGVSETEIQQIKKKYISDRIKESIDLFGSQPERFGTILMTAVAVLGMLISKVLQKARELSTKLFDTEKIPVQKPVRQLPEKESQTKPEIPPKPVMSAEAAAYPKLSKIYKKLKRQNVQKFYRIHHESHNAYVDYKEQEADWEKNYVETVKEDIKKVYMSA